ncbi:DUF2958 domain-containing protein [Sulfurimonas sp. NWX367]|uniref:DUF2958 domain-containing protein n=1 Tax=unclassified Sulfurimonas TaxID=2623549 RepID=UPI00320466A0
MQLLTDKLRKIIPPFYSSEDVELEEKMVYAKFFLTDVNWTWYILEYDQESNSFFALVDGLDQELGYVSLDELEQVRGHMGLHVERDLYFTPTKFGDLKI